MPRPMRSYRPPRTQQQLNDYVIDTIQNDVQFSNTLNANNINLYQCRWEYVADLYELFKYVEAGPPEDVVDELETLIQMYVWAYGTNHRNENANTFTNNITTYLQNRYGMI